MNNTFTAQQVVDAEVEFDEFEEMFADISTLDEDDDGAGVVENQIDQLAADIGLDVASLDGQSLSELAEDEFEQQFIFNFIKRRRFLCGEDRRDPGAYQGGQMGQGNRCGDQRRPVHPKMHQKLISMPWRRRCCRRRLT